MRLTGLMGLIALAATCLPSCATTPDGKRRYAGPPLKFTVNVMGIEAGITVYERDSDKEILRKAAEQFEKLTFRAPSKNPVSFELPPMEEPAAPSPINLDPDAIYVTERQEYECGRERSYTAAAREKFPRHQLCSVRLNQVPPKPPRQTQHRG